jgi:cystathionine beta-lyase/cystathionine gamma-synthase
MKTLGVRLDRQQENAARLAGWLAGHAKVKKVLYPGLVGHPGSETLKNQARGAGAMISFEVVESSLVEKLLTKTEIISFAESLGGVETLITFPEAQTHADIDPEIRQRLGINDRLLRLSVGIEDVEDLIGDLAKALE